MSSDKKDSVDLAGLGKIAKAIPKEVYVQSTAALIDTFTKLTAPITATTEGFGRYLKQKFDNMVEVEKALATYSIEKAIAKAEEKARTRGISLIAPSHPKSFIKSIEETSKETDPLLHEMWTNLLASQITEPSFHPHFVEILPHFSPPEARLLASLFPQEEIGQNGGGYLYFTYDSFKTWVFKSGDRDLKEWNYSCILLCEFKFADVLAPKDGDYDKDTTFLYRTKSGAAFLEAVTP
jgi:hypothetical protein